CDIFQSAMQPLATSIASHGTALEKSHDGDEGSLQMQEGTSAGDGSGADDHTAVAIASVQQATAFNDPSIQYQFRTESSDGQVTYRVVQVDSQGEGQTTGLVIQVASASLCAYEEAITHVGVEWAEARGSGGAGLLVPAFASAHNPDLAVIQSPFGGAGSPASDGIADRMRNARLREQNGKWTLKSKLTWAISITRVGQFYVMMAPQDVLQGGAQRPIAPRTHPYTPKLEGPRTPRDERRRAQHNEVERRRRDKINNWIVELSKYIPDCANDHTKSVQSKGGVLSKACEYIQELRQTNQRMEEELKEAERTQLEHELLMQQFEELKNESALLRTQLQQHGIEVVGSVPGQ
uniref:Upstream transcription factor 2, c-fos interacting n=1 Tax=Petromyzon marinus TaxID=7757 RepID=S4RZ91_PETMA